MALPAPPLPGQTCSRQTSSSEIIEERTYKYITEIPYEADTKDFLKLHPKIGDNVIFIYNNNGYGCNICTNYQNKQQTRNDCLQGTYNRKPFRIPEMYLANFERLATSGQSKSSAGGKRKKRSRYTCKHKRQNTSRRKSSRKRKNMR